MCYVTHLAERYHLCCLAWTWTWQWFAWCNCRPWWGSSSASTCGSSGCVWQQHACFSQTHPADVLCHTFGRIRRRDTTIPILALHVTLIANTMWGKVLVSFAKAEAFASMENRGDGALNAEARRDVPMENKKANALLAEEQDYARIKSSNGGAVLVRLLKCK